ncbi:hypothetical protein [Mesoplasma florum]|uniref:hypothetical protein n=1 Tax=Mesoplasma florum TaxID=2151 RepID=UPI001F332278|nr:hypothetical protein [Mesoplasma florum]
MPIIIIVIVIDIKNNNPNNIIKIKAIFDSASNWLIDDKSKNSDELVNSDDRSKVINIGKLKLL